MPPHRKRSLAALASALASAAGAAACYYVFPSAFMKAVSSTPEIDRIILSGSASAGRVLDGGGGWFNEGRFTEILIRSEEIDGRWERPDGVIIRNGRLRGSIRVVGLGRNGEAEGVRLSSTSPGHTERAQAAAPRGIVISNLEIEADRLIPVYLAPGTTGAVIEDCRFTGWSVAGAVYLDAESAGNTVRNNRFELKCFREVLSIDGSAGNLIERNRFERPDRGGVYLYRNCGEGGTVRHQTPRENMLRGNRFHLASLGPGCHGVWIGSREGRRAYCGADTGHPFGSSLHNRDFADDNQLVANFFAPAHPRSIRDDGEANTIEP